MDSLEQSIMVTVVCLSYNHEQYLKKTLDGLVNQETNFNYEIIVHDDASVDNSASIIREYARKYDFIIPILQKENQYSRNVKFDVEYIFPNINGLFVAFCEGDDYWTDNNKLQLLYDCMIKDDNVSMCCHAYERIDAKTENILSEVHCLKGDGIINANQVIRYINSPQLATMLVRKECVFERAKAFGDIRVWDYPLLLCAVMMGDIYYIDIVMSRYRVASSGSWTERTKGDKMKWIEHDESMIVLLERFAGMTGKEFEKSIRRRVDEYTFEILVLKNDFKSQIRHPLFAERTIKRKIMIFVGIFFPKVISKIVDNIIL